MELALDQQRPGELERHRQRLVLHERALQAGDAAVEIAMSRVEHRSTPETDGADPRRRHRRRGVLHRRDDRLGLLEATLGQRDLDPIALELEPRRMPLAGLRGELGRRRELRVGDFVLLERQRDEAEDVAVERGDDEVPVGEGKLQPLRRQPARLLGPALVGRDEGDAPQPPRREDVRRPPGRSPPWPPRRPGGLRAGGRGGTGARTAGRG